MSDVVREGVSGTASRRMVIAVLSLVGVFVALYLTLYKVGVIGTLECTVGSCETVNTSSWAMLLGLPVAAWGLGFYLAALAVALAGAQERFVDTRGVSLLLVGMSAVGVLFSMWLTYLELFVIHAICMWCVVSAVIVALIFVMSVLDLRGTGSRAQGAGSGEPAEGSRDFTRGSVPTT